MKDDESNGRKTLLPNKSNEMEVQTDSKFLDQFIQPPAPQTQTATISRADVIHQNLKQIDLSKVVLSTAAQEQMLMNHKQSRKRFAAFSLRDKPKEMKALMHDMLPRVGSKFTRNKLDLYYKS